MAARRGTRRPIAAEPRRSSTCIPHPAPPAAAAAAAAAVVVALPAAAAATAAAAAAAAATAAAAAAVVDVATASAAVGPAAVPRQTAHQMLESSHPRAIRHLGRFIFVAVFAVLSKPFDH